MIIILMLQGGGAALTLASVDGDNTIFHGQTGIVVLPATGTFAAAGNRVTIDAGGVRVNQTVTAEGTGSVTFTANLAGLPTPLTTGTLQVHKPR